MEMSSNVASSSLTGMAASATNNSVSTNSHSDDLSNEFLTLMVAQIQNQDPLNPTDGTEYVNQLAQLSMVESNENLVTLAGNNQVMLDNLQVLTTTNLVGRNVEVRTSNVVVGEGAERIEGKVNLQASSNTVTVEVVSSTGAVKSINLGSQEAGMVDFEIDPEELGLEPGEYQLNIVLDDGQTYQPQTYVTGTIKSVNISQSNGEMTLSIPTVGEAPVYDIGSFG